MDLLIENSPETCLSLGLDCGTCIHQAAATVAKISRLEPHGIQQIFLQLYPSPGLPSHGTCVRDRISRVIEHLQDRRQIHLGCGLISIPTRI